MDQSILNTLVGAIQSDESDRALATALFTAMLIVQDKRSYSVEKGKPLSEIRHHIHTLLLRCQGLGEYLEPRAAGANQSAQQVVTFRKVIDSDGQLSLSSQPTLFSIPPEEPNIAFEYDVCISFAGEDRGIAHMIARALKGPSAGLKLRVFYDEFEKQKLWGQELFDTLYEIYSKKCRFCLVLFSEAYSRKAWTRHELRAAQSRVLTERGGYLLPIIVQNQHLPESLSTVSYLKWEETSAKDVAKYIKARRLEEIKTHWFSQEELMDSLRDGFVAAALLDATLPEILTPSTPRELLQKSILALVLATSGGLKERARAFFEFLVFGFPPVANVFDGEDSYTFSCGGRIMRWMGKGGPVLLKEESWRPFIESAKERHPLFQSDQASDGEPTDGPET